MANDDQSNSKNCFLRWMNVQETDLAELHETMNAEDRPDDDAFRQLVDKTIKHYEDYMEQRTQLARNDVSVYFAPTWNCSLGNSLLWVGGCRPTMFIRFVYAACGSEIDSQLAQYLEGTSTDTLGGLSSEQLNLINELHCKTIKLEDKMTSQLAGLQEDLADDPISEMTKGQSLNFDLRNEDLDRVLQDHDKAMADILIEADMFRLNTVKELVKILTPGQAVEFLASAKKLHFCLHKWGKQRDNIHGRVGEE